MEDMVEETQTPERYVGNLGSIVVRKDELLEKLKANRETHRDEFLKAQEGYKITALKTLEDALEHARDGKAGEVRVFLPFPEDHTVDYDHIITAVEMSVDELFELDSRDFARYVLDNWEWKQAWTQSNTAYMAAATR